MYLVLCDTWDRSAIWAARALRGRLAAPVHLISPEMLFSGVWEHRVGSGPPSTCIRISDKFRIDSREVRGVLNRISRLPETLFPNADPDDRAYAIQECSALFMSWIKSLRCPVLNPATAQGLCGAFHAPEQWQVLAAEAGLPSANSAATDIAIVCGGWCTDTRLPATWAPAFARLAVLAETPLLGVEICRMSAQEWGVVNAHPAPDLTAGGARVVDALIHAFGES